MAWPKGFAKPKSDIEKMFVTQIANKKAAHPPSETFSEGTVHWSTLCRKHFHGKTRYVLQVTCHSCNQARWCSLDNVQKRIKCGGYTGCCHHCNAIKSGPTSPRWKGGKRWHSHGYKMLTVPRDHPLVCMRTKRNEIAEHRLIMAEYLGRPLKRTEHIHHKNGNKVDNRIENLELVNGSNHATITALETRIKLLETLLQEHGIPLPE